MDTPIEYKQSDMTREAFNKKYPILKVIDKYDTLLEELFLIRNPRFKFSPDHTGEYEAFKKEHLLGASLENTGRWFYFPWNGRLVHYLDDSLHQELRTARNKNIITEAEQKRWYDFTIAVAGLSVGSHAALTIGMMGGARRIKLADPDEISGSNLNRMRYDFTKVGENKATTAARYLYQMNPYATIEIFKEGITDANMNAFLDGADLVVEEMDNLEMKISLRIEAKKRRLPVVMATDNGDNIIVDIERYDLNPDTKIFNGAAGDLTVEEFKKIAPPDMPKLATKIAGADRIVPRMMESLLLVGKTLYSWPQLGDAATLAGVAIAYTAKRIALGEPLKTGKLEVNLDTIFDPDYEQNRAEREAVRKKFLTIIGLE
ncbi:MAG: thiamine biosynthesis protein ThiF [Candidatus Lloydbacteria bacterium CG22_combo_CG10-13_8_21_14_all_47_15]|uniref:Thiamine biosynthesis protein ThiF n=1 Tax=Candidatus Lloydbacteria bacterium CG22_combo_CG10-13_8_21_14_all_47_15 TaxID=1974635 RepID=A0A2H0CVW4_9BACT|nr:MAG: thiamine biosynthesis protein ThiF [Candidatus Lloydbacteria bacterium CG22_combo_CG10-13_8_21_14_all_47_15]